MIESRDSRSRLDATKPVDSVVTEHRALDRVGDRGVGRGDTL